MRRMGVTLPLMFSPRVGVRAVMWRVSDPHLHTHTHRTYFFNIHTPCTVESSNIDTNRAEESVPYFRGRNASKSGTWCGKRCLF